MRFIAALMSQEIFVPLASIRLSDHQAMLQFKFTYDPGVPLEQRIAFELAARIWGTYVQDDITVNLHIASANKLEGDAIGGAIPIFHQQKYGVFTEYLEQDTTSSGRRHSPSIDEQAINSLQIGNTVDVIVDGELVDGNTDILLTSAQAKALGMDDPITLDNGTTWRRDLVESNALDGYIVINQDYDWNYDFLRQGEAPEGTLDFLTLAMHEVGHQLGFVSGLDGMLNISQLYSGEHQVQGITALDLFRHTVDSHHVDNPDGAVSDLTLGANAYFSVDGGNTNLGLFSTGQQGDGFQAGHWKRMRDALGIMDPTLAYQERLTLTELDLQAIDALGWDVDYAALGSSLNIETLLLDAEKAVANQLGLNGEILQDEINNGRDSYRLGYHQWWQLFESQLFSLGYSQWWQILELGYDTWFQLFDSNLLGSNHNQWWQLFEQQLFDLGYGTWFQLFESSMLDLGYNQWWQLLELGYDQWWQQLETFFSTLERLDNNNSPAFTRVLNQGYAKAGLVRGGADDDIIGGTNVQDRIRGGNGDDLIDGGAGNDILWGDAGRDMLYGHDGYDVLYGGSGDDLLMGERLADQLFGQDGHDILSGGHGNDVLSGGNGRDELKGGEHKDILQGGNHDDSLEGGEDHDLLMGAAGRDAVRGDSGDDILYGDEVLAEARAELNRLRRDFLNNIWQQARDLRAENTETVATQVGSLSKGIPTTTDQSSTNGVIRIEAEDMTLSGGYRVESRSSASDGFIIQNPGHGTQGKATTTFTGESGRFMVVVHYLDESDGVSSVAINVAGQTIDNWLFDGDGTSSRTVSTNLQLNSGNQIEILSTSNLGERARIDYIDLIPLESILESPISNSGDTLLQNGDFSENLTGWKTFKGNAQTTQSGAYSGKSANLDAGDNGISQWVEISGGETYQFSAVSKLVNADWGGIGVNFMDENWQLIGERRFDINSVNWKIYQDSITAPENAKYAIIWASKVGNGGQLLLDNVLLQKDVATSTNTAFEQEAPGTIAHQVQPWKEDVVAHWSFDEISGKKTTDTIGNLSGTLINMETTDQVNGIVGKALNFDGVNESVVVGDTSSLSLSKNNDDFSVAFWIKPEADATGKWRKVIHRGATNQERTFAIWMHPHSNRLHYRISTTASWNEGGNSQTALEVNEWTHIAYVREGDRLLLYLNGELDSSVALRGSVIANDGPLRIGSPNLDASMDEVYLYDRALSTTDLESLALVNADILEGGQGRDTLYGNEGDDQLYGESQNTYDPVDGTSTAGVFRGAESLIADHNNTMLLNEGTLAFSFQADHFSSTQYLFSKDANGYVSGGHLSVEVETSGRLSVRLQSVATSHHVQSRVLNVNQAYNIAITFGSNGLELWVDGQRVDTNSYTGGLGSSSGGTGNYEPIVLGASQTRSGSLVADNLDDHFSGTLQNVRLLDQQLDGPAIAHLPTELPNGVTTVFEALVPDEGNNDVLVGGQGHDILTGNLGDDILYGDDATALVDGIRRHDSLYLLTQNTDWFSAQAQAELLGGNLVTVNDAAEQTWLRDTFGTTEGLWIGFTDHAKEGQWRWSSGETTTYVNWSPGQPDNYGGDQHHAYLNASASGRWDDGGASINRRGIIEIKVSSAAGNDVLIGSVGNDVLYGELGNDVLNGTSASAAGAYEYDVLVGGAGADLFILGDINQAYYTTSNNLDYALVKDFNAGEDIVQLYGIGNDYTQQQIGGSQQLYYQGDLVAIFENVTALNLSTGFAFVG